MKYVILLALLAMALAQTQNPGYTLPTPQPGHNPDFEHEDPLHSMIHNEVYHLFTENPHITVQECFQKCDALFNLAADHDEQDTDSLCLQECVNFHAYGPHEHEHEHEHHPTTGSV